MLQLHMCIEWLSHGSGYSFTHILDRYNHPIFMYDITLWICCLSIPCIHIKDTMWCATACCVMSIFLFIEFSIQVTMVILNIAIEKVVYKQISKPQLDCIISSGSITAFVLLCLIIHCTSTCVICCYTCLSSEGVDECWMWVNVVKMWFHVVNYVCEVLLGACCTSYGCMLLKRGVVLYSHEFLSICRYVVSRYDGFIVKHVLHVVIRRYWFIWWSSGISTMSLSSATRFTTPCDSSRTTNNSISTTITHSFTTIHHTFTTHTHKLTRIHDAFTTQTPLFTTCTHSFTTIHHTFTTHTYKLTRIHDAFTTQTPLFTTCTHNFTTCTQTSQHESTSQHSPISLQHSPTTLQHSSTPSPDRHV